MNASLSAAKQAGDGDDVSVMPSCSSCVRKRTLRAQQGGGHCSLSHHLLSDLNDRGLSFTWQHCHIFGVNMLVQQTMLRLILASYLLAYVMYNAGRIGSVAVWMQMQPPLQEMLPLTQQVQLKVGVNVHSYAW